MRPEDHLRPYAKYVPHKTDSVYPSTWTYYTSSFTEICREIWNVRVEIRLRHLVKVWTSDDFRENRTGPFFREIFVNNSCTDFYENLTDGFVSDTNFMKEWQTVLSMTLILW
jgi:hypothetical protein